MQIRKDPDLIRDRVNDFMAETVDALLQIGCTDSFINSAEAIAACKSKIVTVGIGKAGHIARKSASTFCSLNIPSVYLHPGDASHGDAGIITKDDVLLAFSTSGKTREVIEVAKLAKQLKIAKSIAITSHLDAPLRKVCDYEIDMGKIEESGWLHIAPTTSTMIMLVISDMLATIAAELRGVTMEDFALRHHSGYLAVVCKKKLKEKKIC